MALQLSTDASRVHVVNVRPVVVAGVLDQHIRRNDGQDRVIGVLLGTNVAGTVEITNSFGVFHTWNRADNSVRVRQTSVKALLDLHKRINPSEVPVGWYATASSDALIDDITLAVHTFFMELIPKPIHLVFDTRLAADKVDILAYTVLPNSLTKDLMVTFQQLQVHVVATPEERVGIHTMLKSKPSGGGSTIAGEVADIVPMMATLDASMRRLKTLLDVVIEYVDDVVAGKRAPDESIGRQIADALAAVPNVDAATFEKSFDGSVRDVLMVSYLANLTAAHMNMMERISQLPPRAPVH